VDCLPVNTSQCFTQLMQAVEKLGFGQIVGGRIFAGFPEDFQNTNRLPSGTTSSEDGI